MNPLWWLPVVVVVVLVALFLYACLWTAAPEPSEPVE
jgi:hypothetical protein